MGERYRQINEGGISGREKNSIELFNVVYKEAFGYSDKLIEKIRKTQVGEEKLTKGIVFKAYVSLRLRNRRAGQVIFRMQNMLNMLSPEEQEVTKYTVGLGIPVKDTNQIAIITNIHPDKVDTLIASSLNKLKPKEK